MKARSLRVVWTETHQGNQIKTHQCIEVDLEVPLEIWRADAYDDLLDTLDTFETDEVLVITHVYPHAGALAG
ncbi:hypothetical protein [Deinococcus multiflagellatus]|uniref:Uncharacterized protein n=1 Tax=Deinococcus multiflagellatus TaxID=1656887 RepID=A0ABW1ZR94_9DEIO|nr:hypothetical protein [Deinococcus multiflagellatus]MBZ9715385.1 hypothetical protein [Deinococcus multiflagellatus]